MSLSGVLCLKQWIFNFLLASFLLFPTNPQIIQKTGAVEQTSFSMEFAFERPVLLSEAAKKALATDQGIADVMKDDQLSIESIPKDWFTAAEVHLGPKNETDLVVMGLGISLGPYNAGFWVLRQTPQGYEIVLAVNTHDLALLDSSTNGFRDIETNLPTLNQSYRDIYKFDGYAYRKEPTAQENQSASGPQLQSSSGPVEIVPGQSVGPLRLGDTRERTFELFPYKPNMDQEWLEGDGCGTTVNWLDMKKEKMAGNIFIRLKEGRVFQVDSGTTSFHTSRGITMGSSPQEIRKHYPGLRAFILSTGFSEASGGRPLIYWVDTEKGIAFAFAHSRKSQELYLNWIIIFELHAEVCPEYPPLKASDRRELSPYSLEPD